LGDHVAVVVQFRNDKTEHTEGGELTAICWLDATGHTTHEFGDALLAVGGGDDHAIHIVSVAEGRVVKLIKGHSADILALSAGTSSASDARPEILVSLALDGTAILWNWRTEERVCTYKVGDAVSVTVKPDGSGMYTGHKDGKVREWTFPAPAAPPPGNAKQPVAGTKRANADVLTAAEAGAVAGPCTIPLFSSTQALSVG
jgi:WD40 repeat protein